MNTSRYILLSNIKIKLFWLWTLFSLLLAIGFFIQSVTGLIKNIENKIWSWYFILLLPGLLLSTASVLLSNKTDKIINKTIYILTFSLNFIYLFAILFVFLLSRQAIYLNEFGLDIYYEKSFWVLAPFNVLVLTGLLLTLFLNKKSQAELVIPLANNLAFLALKNNFSFQEECINHVRLAETEKAVEKMLGWFKDKDTNLYNDLIIIDSRYNLLKKDIRNGVVVDEEKRIQYARINLSLLELAGQINS